MPAAPLSAHNSLESSAFRSVAVPIPDGDAAIHEALDGTPVEGCEDG